MSLFSTVGSWSGRVRQWLPKRCGNKVPPMDENSVIKLLIIGGTGQGKSTLVNYILSSSLNKPMTNPAIAIPTQYHLIPNVCGYQNSEQDKSDQTTSKTKHCKNYDVFIGGTTRKWFRLIDMPGLNETVGNAQSDASQVEIYRDAVEARNLRAIIIEVDGTNPSSASSLQILLDQLKNCLPESILRNLIFVVTNAGGCAFELNSLKQLVPEHATTLYFYDSAASAYGEERNGPEGNILPSNEWKTSMQTIHMLLSTVAGMTDVSSGDSQRVPDVGNEAEGRIPHTLPEVVETQRLANDMECSNAANHRTEETMEQNKNNEVSNLVQRTIALEGVNAVDQGQEADESFAMFVVPLLHCSDENASGAAFGNFELDLKHLRDVLLKPEFRDKPIIPISIVGPFRTGKSYLLNFLLDFLLSNTDEWLRVRLLRTNEYGVEQCGIKGIANLFGARGGSDGVTSGIQMWHEPILWRQPNGENTVVLLFDFQGLFDTKLDTASGALLFAMAAFCSSIVVLNSNGNIDESQINNAAAYASFGRELADRLDKQKQSEGDTTKDLFAAMPFQLLQFLVRDWAWPGEHRYDFDGGKQFLANRMYVDIVKHTEEHKIARAALKESFVSAEAFLMPRPIYDVEKAVMLLADPAKLEQVFLESVKKFAVGLMERAKPKQFRGKQIIAAAFASYVELFYEQRHKVAPPCSPYEAMTNSGFYSAYNAAITEYRTVMMEACLPRGNGIDLANLRSNHRSAMSAALVSFASKSPRMLTVERIKAKHRDVLEADMESEFSRRFGEGAEYWCSERSSHTWNEAGMGISAGGFAVGIAATAALLSNPFTAGLGVAVAIGSAVGFCKCAWNKFKKKHTGREATNERENFTTQSPNTIHQQERALVQDE